MMNGNSYDHHHHHHHQNFREHLLDGYCNGGTRSSSNGYATVPLLSSSINSPPSPSRSSAVGSGLNYIEHRVSKMDTVAGIAIKYGVEVIRLVYFNLFL